MSYDRHIQPAEQIIGAGMPVVVNNRQSMRIRLAAKKQTTAQAAVVKCQYIDFWAPLKTLFSSDVILSGAKDPIDFMGFFAFGSEW